MPCKKCQNQPELPPSVLEIVNNCDPVLFHKVIFPASLGDDTTNPPDTLNYKNVLLQFEANKHTYLYSSDGAATQIPTGETDLKAIKEELAQHGIDIDNLQTEVANLQTDLATETTNREEGDATLQANINTEATTREQADKALEDSIDTLTDDLESEAHARIQADTALQTSITANTTAINNLKSDLADTTSELQGDIASEALARQDADEALQKDIDANTSEIDAINTNLDVYVEKETEFNGNDSTLDVVHTKVNLKTSATEETTDALPVASESNAGIMNSATYTAVQRNSENVDSILNGAVALTGLPEEPTQADLTDQWKTATGKTELINRADIYDVTNEKRWTYYENTNTWYSASTNGGSVEISQATNDSLGLTKGSTKLGQNFVEADGSTSLNGFDQIQENIANLQSTSSEQGELLNTTVAQLEETQKDANDALADIAAIQADYVGKSNIKTINGESIVGTGNIEVASQDTIDDVLDELDSKQATLVSGQNIKTINGESVLGSGNIEIAGGSSAGVPAFMVNVSNYTVNLEDSSFGTEPELGQMVAIGVESSATVLRYITLNGGTEYPVYVNGLTTSGSNASSIGVNLRPALLVICVFCGTQWRTVNVGRGIATADITGGAVTIDKIASSSIMTVDEFNAAWEAA